MRWALRGEALPLTAICGRVLVGVGMRLPACQGVGHDSDMGLTPAERGAVVGARLLWAAVCPSVVGLLVELACVERYGGC
jgi:hypothetical protein